MNYFKLAMIILIAMIIAEVLRWIFDRMVLLFRASLLNRPEWYPIRDATIGFGGLLRDEILGIELYYNKINQLLYVYVNSLDVVLPVSNDEGEFLDLGYYNNSFKNAESIMDIIPSEIVYINDKVHYVLLGTNIHIVLSDPDMPGTYLTPQRHRELLSFYKEQ